MESEQYRIISRMRLSRLGIQIPNSLPFLDAIAGDIKTVDCIVDRMFCLHAVAASAHGYDRMKALRWLERESLIDDLTESERKFLSSSNGIPSLRMAVEALWALAWSTSIVPKIEFNKECSNKFVKMMPDLIRFESGEKLRVNADIRPIEQIYQEADTAYCAHWAIVSAMCLGQQSPFRRNAGFIIKRRRAFEWIICREEWDTISMDT